MTMIIGVAYFTTLPVPIQWRRMVRLLIDERWIGKNLEGIGRDPKKVLPGIFQEGLKKATKSSSQDGRCPSRDWGENLQNTNPERYC
jgi:hypothetical protein